MGRVTLLRHTTPAVAPGTCYGRSNLGLAEGFPQEAERILDTLPEFDCLITSPLDRCRLLAEQIAAHAGIPAQVAPGWTEMDFGAWEGRPWSDLAPADLDAWAADFLHYCDHGGESVAQLRDRIKRALQALPEGNCLVVTHMGCIKAARHLHGDADGWNHNQLFGSMTILSSSV